MNEKLSKRFYLYAILISVALLLPSCYGFTSGTVAEHLKTIYIATIEDNSGYGDPLNRTQLTQYILDRFRNDNTLELVDRNGDAKLFIKISSITEQSIAVNQNELESEKKVVVKCNAEYYDAVKKQQIWKQSFSNFQVYEIANAFTAKKEAIDKALDQISEDIFFAVVSNW